MSQKEQDRRIDYVEIPATDLAAMKSFYKGVFGWSFKDQGPDYASFNDGRMRGGLRKEDRVPPGGPLIVLYSVDPAPLEERIREHGGRIVRRSLEFPGGRRFHFTDPSGNELAVWSER